MVTELETALSISFLPGSTPGVRFMAHLAEPLRAMPRPLLLYAGLEAAAALGASVLARYGFVTRRHG